MKKKLLVLLYILAFCSFCHSQNVKRLKKINSIYTGEIINFKYNSKNQVIYFDEQSNSTYREFKLKYDKDNKLVECIIDEDWGESITTKKYEYKENYILDRTEIKGKRLSEKLIEENKIFVDNKGRILKTVFEDGHDWENFEYDDLNNLITYYIESLSGQRDMYKTYTYANLNSIFLTLNSIPSWFWLGQIIRMQWVEGFTGKNCVININIEDLKYGAEEINISYEYDDEGYPIKQLYNNELVKEFEY